VFAIDRDDPELDGLAHDSLPVRPGTAPMSFDAAQHLVSSAVTDDQHAAQSHAGSLRTRLARLLDAVSGTADDS